MLVGRADELERLDDLMAGVGSGAGSVVLVEGPAGIGKTALLAEGAQRARCCGFSVLRGIGAELERGYSFGVVRQVFASVVGGSLDSAALFEGAARLAAAPLGLGAASADVAAGTADAMAAALHGLYWLTANLSARAPLALVVDDAHWADAMSLRFVLYLARRMEDLPVLLLVAARPMAEHGDDGLLTRLGAIVGVSGLRPAALRAPDVQRLIVDRGMRNANERFVQACLHASGGNPFLLGELLAELDAEGADGSEADAARVVGVAPETIVRWVSARLASLGGSASELAFAYAVLGGDAMLSDAAVLAGLEPSGAAAVTDALVAAHVLTAAPAHEFVHPLVRDAVYEAMPPGKRATAHTDAARLIADRGVPTARVAAHLLAAGPGRDLWVVEVLRAAGRAASASGAAESAVVYLERALQEAQPCGVRAELLLELGEPRLRAGMPGGTERIREGLELHADPRRRAEICLILGRAFFSAGEDGPAREALREGLRELPDGEDDLLAELRGWYMAVAREEPGLSPRLRALVRMLQDDAGVGRTRTERALLVALARESALSGGQSREQVAGLARRALADGALFEDGDMGRYASACQALWVAGEVELAIVELDRAIASSQRRGWQAAFGWYSLLRGMAQYLRGDLLAAIADVESARNAQSAGYGRGRILTRAILGLCLLERDDIAGAADALALPGEKQLRETRPLISYLYALACLSTAQGRPREGLNTLLECERRVRRMNEPNPAAKLPWRSDAALLAARLGEHDRAEELAAEDLRLARAFGAPHALGVALRTAGLLDGGSSGLDRLAEAIAVLDGSGFNLELARTLIEQGAALRRGGRRREARQPLSRGLDLAASCGAVALSKRARDELLAAGARPRRERLRGVDALTASERRIARMAADGMNNREIAQGLFITIRTVTTHLGHAYQKLDIAGREELAEKLGREPGAALA